MPDYKLEIGNSSQGQIGLCVYCEADNPQEALEWFKDEFGYDIGIKRGRYYQNVYLNWEAITLNEIEECEGDDDECEGCDGSGIRPESDNGCGVKPPDGYVAVERCDTCEKYPGDLEAASVYGTDAKWQAVPNGHIVQAICKPRELVIEDEEGGCQYHIPLPINRQS